MSRQPCNCPSYEGLSYEEIIEVSGLKKRKDQSKNCCELAGYICPVLDRALVKARNKRESYKRNSDDHSPRQPKTLKKRRLQLRLS